MGEAIKNYLTILKAQKEARKFLASFHINFRDKQRFHYNLELIFVIYIRFKIKRMPINRQYLKEELLWVKKINH